jgi:quinol monooxygenase YgiN
MRFLPIALLALLLAPAARAQTEGPAFILTYIEVAAGATQQGLAILRQYRAAVRKESGNRGIELIQEMGRPNRLVIFEIWPSQPDFEAHDNTAAAAQLRDRLKPIEIAQRDRRVHQGFALGGNPLSRRGAVYAVSHIDVNPSNRPATEPILKQLVEDSRKDAGNLRFDVYRQNNASNHFGSLAVWRNRKAFEAYEKTAHVKAARIGLAPLLGALYDERLYRVLE